MRRHFVGAIVVLGGLILACDKPGTPDAPPAERYALEELDVLAILGAEPQGDPLSVFQRALDAVLLEDRIVVLDASPPFTRAFDFDGQYLTSAIEEGDGPGSSGDRSASAGSMAVPTSSTSRRNCCGCPAPAKCSGPRSTPGVSFAERSGATAIS